MINNIEKIEILQSKINMMNLHVSALLDDISREPLGDDPEKPTRQSVLNDIISVIDVLEIEKLALTNQG
jgi:hypothetical protein